MLLLPLALAATLTTPPPLTGTTWELRQLKPGRGLITLNDRIDKPTLRMVGGQVTGFTACSPLTGRVQFGKSTIRFEALGAGSSAACPDRILGLREDYTRLLEQAIRYQIRGQTLTIWSKSGQLIFRQKDGQR